ncbi:MAG: SGNH/GDSL hydrolase family protein [Aureispira sp.]|nr:SGNH/GDSL hydrolase family protein [Aureispira sp.]
MQSICSLAQTTIINPCAQVTDIHVVVIGSSTAAGSGPSSPDSAWVNRYRKYLQNINPQNQVTNLAIGGTNTYNIMPSWFSAAGKPATNPSNNITQAISLGADAIIVNMPSNDAAGGFGINEQMSNFITIKNSADSANIPVWVCTTQPRNSLSAAGKAIQIGVRDSILTYFGDYAIDFWNGCADASHNIFPQYNSGDGVHMNNAGHRILNNRVIAEGISNIVADTALATDHVLVDLYLENISVCGGFNTSIYAIIANVGQASSSSIMTQFEVVDNITSNLSNFPFSIQPLGTCSLDTVNMMLNTYNGVDVDIQAYLTNTDVNKTNDTSQVIGVYTKGHPTITIVHDTVCLRDSSTLFAMGSSSMDTKGYVSKFCIEIKP